MAPIPGLGYLNAHLSANHIPCFFGTYMDKLIRCDIFKSDVTQQFFVFGAYSTEKLTYFHEEACAGIFLVLVMVAYNGEATNHHPTEEWIN